MPLVSSTLKSFEKWRSPLFGATGNFNHQILPYGILQKRLYTMNFQKVKMYKEKVSTKMSKILTNYQKSYSLSLKYIYIHESALLVIEHKYIQLLI
jgi:hypothetical protein